MNTDLIGFECDCYLFDTIFFDLISLKIQFSQRLKEEMSNFRETNEQCGKQTVEFRNKSAKCDAPSLPI